MGGGKSGSGKQQVNEYNMSLHFGVCAELDAITAIYVGSKQAWAGEITAGGPIEINRDDLFGGAKKEGGVRGIAYYLPGDRDQVLPNGLAAKRGLTFDTHPAYRGLASVYFTGALPGVNANANGGTPGFYWGATPYLQDVWVTGRRAPKGLDPAFALIGNQTSGSFNGYVATIGGVTQTLTDGHLALVGSHAVTISVNSVDSTKTITLDGLTVIVQPFVTDDDGDQRPGTTVSVNGTSAVVPSTGTVAINGVSVRVSGATVGIASGTAGGTDANPAHIVYECLTNTIWGMGAAVGLVDRVNHNDVGVVLYNEGFGLSLQWTREASIEDFVREILDHIQAALYVDPETGLLTLKLFRDDYDQSTLPLISPDNAVLDNFQRKLWGETVNEIVVSWTNPVNEQEETITQQDLGNITIQGAAVSDSRNYYAIRNADLATRIAQRDVRQSSAPLASVEALLDRSEWNLKPGSVVRMTWPEYEIENLVMRVMNIDYGKIGNPSITVTLMEDIFSLEDAAFTSAPTGGFGDPSRAPTPMNHVSVFTAPAYFTTRYLTAAEAAAREYPAVLTTVLAANTNSDTSFYELVGLGTSPTGSAVSEKRGTKAPLGWTTLSSALIQEDVTVIPTFGRPSPGVQPSSGGFVFIGDGTEATIEIALLESLDANGWHLQRGVFDTVPRAWPAGTSVWFFDGANNIFDDDSMSAGEDVVYKLLTSTSQGSLALNAAPIVGADLSARPYLPNRPANVRVNGVGFGVINVSAAPPITISVTWANRNRLLEDSTVLRWTDATVTPEEGQTTTIRLTKTSDGTTITTIDGLTGTSYDLPLTAFGSEYEADLHISAKRANFESLQHVVRRVRVATNAAPLIDPGNGSTDVPYAPPPTTFPPF